MTDINDIHPGDIVIVSRQQQVARMDVLTYGGGLLTTAEGRTYCIEGDPEGKYKWSVEKVTPARISVRNKDLKKGDKVRLTQGNKVKIGTVASLGLAAVTLVDDIGYYWNSAESHHDFVNKNNMWDIELIKEETMGTEIKEEKITRYEDLKPGDVLRITREVTVTSAGGWDGIRTKDGRQYRIAAADRSLPGFEVVRLTKVNPHPANWPPQNGDVWEKSGNIFHVHMSGYSGTLRAYSEGGTEFTVSVLDCQDFKLVYRKGNDLR
jgi:hypothetical protein